MAAGTFILPHHLIPLPHIFPAKFLHRYKFYYLYHLTIDNTDHEKTYLLGNRYIAVSFCNGTNARTHSRKYTKIQRDMP